MKIFVLVLLLFVAVGCGQQAEKTETDTAASSVTMFEGETHLKTSASSLSVARTPRHISATTPMSLFIRRWSIAWNATPFSA